MNFKKEHEELDELEKKLDEIFKIGGKNVRRDNSTKD